MPTQPARMENEIIKTAETITGNASDNPHGMIGALATRLALIVNAARNPGYDLEILRKEIETIAFLK